jgi:hypothetical protein
VRNQKAITFHRLNYLRRFSYFFFKLFQGVGLPKSRKENFALFASIKSQKIGRENSLSKTQPAKARRVRKFSLKNGACHKSRLFNMVDLVQTAQFSEWIP